MEVRLGERSLVEAAQAGDGSAFGALVTEHQPIALRLAYVLMRDHSDAQDVTQEAFVRAYAALGRFDAERSFRPWLLTIVRNTASNRRRRLGRQAALSARAPVPGSVPSAEEMELGAAEASVVLHALADLPKRQRVVVECRYLLDLSETETAQVLGLPVGTVKSRTSRAMLRLRAVLGGARGENT